MKLYKKIEGTDYYEEAGLKDIMAWFVKTYPKDIFVGDMPVPNFRDWCITILNSDNTEEANNGN